MFRIPAVILFVAVMLGAVLLGRLIAVGNIFIVFGILLAAIVGLITFQNPENGLILLVFSMLLSPEIELAKIPGRSITVRIDDFLLVAVFIAYIAYHAITPHARKFIKTPIDTPLVAIVLVYFISTALGIFDGRLKPLTSFFFVLKYIQYFILFWLAVNIINSLESLKKIIIAGTITAIVVAVYAYSLFPTAERVYPPFDHDAAGTVGEAGTLGGYLLIIMSLALSFFMNYEKQKVRYFSLGLLLFLIPPFIRTLSRASYYSIGIVIPALVFFSPKRKFTLVVLTLFSLAAAPLIVPDLTSSAINRMKETFTGPKSDLGINLELSAAARVDSWKNAFTIWLPKRPFFGHGATGVGLVDAQFPRIIGEFGLIGFITFIWLIYSIFKMSVDVLKNAKSDLSVSVSIGLLAALIGLLFQSIGVNTFIIVRIMQPFWFLAAVVGVLHRLENASET